VVTTPHISALRDAEKVLSLLRPYSLGAVSVVLNRVRGDTEVTGDTVTAAEVSTFLNCPVVGVIPDSDGMNELSTLSEPLPRKSEAAIAVGMLCKRLHTGCGELYDATRRYRGFFGAIKRGMKRIL
jgi:septum site-determining protein MinD